MHQPSTSHKDTFKRVLRYLVGTTDMDIFFSASSPSTLHAYTDVDWYEIKMTTFPLEPIQSTRARTPFLGWHESKEVLQDLPRTKYMDNICATYLAVNPVFHSRMKL